MLVCIDFMIGEVLGCVKIDEMFKYGDIDIGGGKIWLCIMVG